MHNSGPTKTSQDPPYSPDLVPCDFSPKIKIAVKLRYFFISNFDFQLHLEKSSTGGINGILYPYISRISVGKESGS